MPTARRPPLPDLAVAAAVVLLSIGYAVVIWRAGQAAGVRFPLGSDGPLWFDSARLAGSGEEVGLPPMYPRLLSLLSGGVPQISVGLALNAVLVGLTLLGAGATGALSAAAPRARQVAALGAPLVVLVAADPAAYAWYMHPEPLITAALVWCGAAAVAAVRWPSRKTAGLLGLACGIALGAKEHGLVVTALAPLLLLVGGRPGVGRRAAAWLVCLSPFLISQALDGALFAKAWSSVQESLGWLSQDPNSMAVLPVEMTAEQQQQVRDGGLLGMSARQLLAASRAWWPAFGAAALAGVGLLARRQVALVAALGLPLATLAPALVLWTEPRHYLVVAPAAAAFAVAGAGRLAGSSRPGVIGLALGCGLALVAMAPQAGARLGETLAEIDTLQRERGDEYEALMWLIAHLDIDDRVLLEIDPVVLGKSPFMPIPRGQPLRPETLPAAAYLVTQRDPPDGWSHQATLGTVRIYRLER
ncbi:MAG: hypothetical protein ACI8S6_000113 [Myxococcota bacterium]|jgi:hypothetical protein